MITQPLVVQAASKTIAHEIVSSVTDKGMTTVEKLTAIHDALIYRTSYGYNDKYSETRGQDVLKYGIGICEGYANAFQLLCNEAGITCDIVIGIAKGQPHAWNKVKLSDGWYNVDCTWDDPVLSDTYKDAYCERYDYFLISTKLLKYDHVWNNARYEKKEGKKYLYYGQYELEQGIPVAVKVRAFTGDNFRAALKEISIPSSVKIIKSTAFGDCVALSEIKLPKKLEKIAFGVFLGCKKLMELDIPDSVTDIEQSAFEETPWLKRHKDEFVIVGDGVLIETNLRNYTDVVIPNGVKIIGSVFHNREDILQVEIPSSVTAISSDAFSFSSLQKIIIPNSVKKIGENAFYGCHDLSEVTLPDQLDYIGNHAFGECYGIDYPMISDYIDKYPKAFDEVYLTNATEDFLINQESTLITYLGESDEVTIPDTVTYIGCGAFSGNDIIRKITIPASVKKIDEEAFCYCSNLETALIEYGVQEIGDYAFGFTDIKKVIIPRSVKRVGNGAFKGAHITSVVIENGTVEIGDDAFQYTPLKKIVLPASIKSIGDKALFSEWEPRKVVVECKKNTYAYSYAYRYNLKMKIQ